ncbi:uncharacterized protein LOC134536217 [Bacillus rossius redtenbacheri]|uniref:uncharacterized protein LOC134536217 n=1 Tax=Bacillus rossius redtenbacheri TaxID=93214 RepID=UPI002FDD4684
MVGDGSGGEEQALGREELVRALRQERDARRRLEAELQEKELQLACLRRQLDELRARPPPDAEVPVRCLVVKPSGVVANVTQADSIPNAKHVYNKSAGFADMSGEWYEIKMATLLFLRGLNYTEDFFLATNFDGAGIFDDIVFKYTARDPAGEPKTRICFLQLKHKQRAVITHTKLFGPKGAFSLASYYKSFCEVRKTMSNNPDFEFCGPFPQFEFILYTNAESQLEFPPCKGPCCAEANHIFSTSSESQTVCESALRVVVAAMSRFKALLGGLKTRLAAAGPDDAREIVQGAIDELEDTIEHREMVEKLTKLKQKPSRDEVDKLIKEVEQWGDLSKYPEFLRQFKMLTSQASESQLDKLIKQEVVRMFQTPEMETDLIFADLKEKMQNWWKDGNTNYYLTKSAQLWLEMMKLRVLELSMSEMKMLQSLDVKYSEDNVCVLSSAIQQNKVINVFASGKSTKLTCLKVYQAMNAVTKDDYLFVSLSACLSRQGEIISVWQSAWCDYLVIDCEVTAENLKSLFDIFAKILYDYETKKIVFVTLPSDVKLSNAIGYFFRDVDMNIEIHDMFKLTCLEEQSQMLLLKKDVNFQGFDVPLGKLIGQHLELKEAVCTEIIDKFLSGEKLTIGEELPDVVEYYVSRTLQRQHFIKQSILKTDDSGVAFAISGAKKEDIQSLIPPREIITYYRSHHRLPKKVKCRYFLLEGCDESTAFAELCEKFSAIHWLKYDNGKFVWRQSHGDLLTLRKYVMKENISYDLDSLLTLPDRTVVIVAEPGMGKSTFLTYVAKQIKKRDPSLWVLKVNLNDYTCYLNTIQLEQLQDGALEFLELVASVNSQSNAELVRMLLKYSYLFTGRLVILLDGFDEVCPNYTDKVSKLLELFMASRIKRLWVTSRPVMQTKLEQELYSVPFTLKPFTEKDQTDTLKKFWKELIVDNERADMFINQLLHRTAQFLNDKDKYFTGIPLQTLLLAEVFENDFKMYQDSKQFDFEQECDLFLLYDRFVEKKWDVYLSEKKKEDTSNIGVRHDNEDLKNIFMGNHMMAALLRILSPRDLTSMTYSDLKVKGSRFIGRIEQGYDHTGIILGITDGVPRFVHRTFAEYFTAKWFALNFSENRDFIEHNFCESSYEVVKSLFDRILANDFELHVAVLRNDVASIKHLLNSSVDVNVRDLGGRTALHLAAMIKHGSEIVDMLIQHGANVNILDEVLLWTPLRYADKLRAWSVIGTILQNKGDFKDLVLTKQTSSDGDYIISALHAAAKGGYVELLTFLLYSDKYTNVTLDSDKCCLLHVAAQYGRKGVLELLLSKGANIMSKDKNERTALHFASKNGHLNIVQCLLDYMKKKEFIRDSYKFRNLLIDGLNAQEKEGKTPLFIAAEFNHLEVIQYLAEKGADVNICSRDGYSPLYVALLKGNMEIVHFLKDKALVDTGTSNGWTLMHTAATNGHLNVIEHLKTIDADVNACNKYGQTPLHIAAKKNKVDVLQYLIKEGAVLDVQDTIFGWTALNYAIKEEHQDIVQHLLEAGARLHIPGAGDKPLEQSFHYKCDCFSASPEDDSEPAVHKRLSSWAPLFLATWHGYLSIVQALTAKGATLDAWEATTGRTALHIAAEKNHVEIARHLIKQGASIDQPGALDGKTPLHVASQKGHMEMVQLLVGEGAGLEERDRMNGQSPLHYAAWCCYDRLALFLIGSGADIDATDRSGWTPLHIAAEKNHLDMVVLLVDNGADVNARTKTYGWTPLHYAAKYGRSDIVEFLVRRGALLDVHDTMRGQTPLHISAENSHLHVVRLLINGGAKVNVYDSNNMTPLDIAEAQSDVEIITFLKPFADSSEP